MQAVLFFWFGGTFSAVTDKKIRKKCESDIEVLAVTLLSGQRARKGKNRLEKGNEKKDEHFRFWIFSKADAQPFAGR